MMDIFCRVWKSEHDGFEKIKFSWKVENVIVLQESGFLFGRGGFESLFLPACVLYFLESTKYGDSEFYELIKFSSITSSTMGKNISLVKCKKNASIEKRYGVCVFQLMHSTKTLARRKTASLNPARPEAYC